MALRFEELQELAADVGDFHVWGQGVPAWTSQGAVGLDLQTVDYTGNAAATAGWAGAGGRSAAPSGGTRGTEATPLPGSADVRPATRRWYSAGCPGRGGPARLRACAGRCRRFVRPAIRRPARFVVPLPHRYRLIFPWEP
ncbi:hypothetical protein GCM10009078_11510 [Cupriavidus gilardii]